MRRLLVSLYMLEDRNQEFCWKVSPARRCLRLHSADAARMHRRREGLAVDRHGAKLLQSWQRPFLPLVPRGDRALTRGKFVGRFRRTSRRTPREEDATARGEDPQQGTFVAGGLSSRSPSPLSSGLPLKSAIFLFITGKY